MRFLKVFILVLPLFLSHFVSAQSSWKELTSAELIIETTGVPKNDPFEIGFLVKLKPGWHTYWKNAGQSGARPRFEWESRKEIGEAIFPTPRTFVDSGIVTFGYEDQVLFVFKHPGLSETETIKLSAEWLVCKEICLPALSDFEITIPVLDVAEIESTPHRSSFDGARRRWPLAGRVTVETDGNEAVYSIAAPKKPKDFSFFPYATIPYEKLLPIRHEHDGETFRWVMPLAKADSKISELGGVLEFKHDGYSESFDLNLEREAGGFVASTGSMVWLVIFAFIGGVILNLMPCVFPILSLKLFSVLKTSGHDLRRVRLDNLAYVAGVLASFLILGFGLSLFRQAGAQVGWGFQLQSPLFVGLLILLFVVLALEMLGFFEFDLLDPSKGQSLAQKGGWTGSFFTGVLAVVVASPCTAPFMGAAVGAALTQQGWFSPLIFLSLGLGLAFPYLLLAISPKLLGWVPKPGFWMKVVKEVMAFPLLLTAVWLTWVFTHIAVADDLFALGICLVGIVFGIWLAGYSRKAAWLVSLVFLSAWVSHGIFKAPGVGEFNGEVQNTGWEAFSSDAIFSRKEGEVLFVNMTADWCITCKVNERLVFETAEVRELFESLEIKKVKGDWTRRDPKITVFLDGFGRAGVPFYVIYSDKTPSGEVLPEILTKEQFMKKIKSHAAKGEKS